MLEYYNIYKNLNYLILDLIMILHKWVNRLNHHDTTSNLLPKECLTQI